MYGGDNTGIVVYNMERWLKGGGERKNTKKRITLKNNQQNTETIMIFLLE